MKLIEHYVGGKKIPGTSDKKGKVFNPATGEQESEVRLASKADLDEAVSVAKKAFETWSLKPSLQRARVMFKFKELIEKNSDELTKLIVSEHGKVYEDAKGSLTRGLEVVEFACGIPHLLKGEFSENVGTNVDSWSMRQPLGVVAGITPFNFPAMVPMWMFPIAIACGNTFILKPSEKDPSCAIKLAELLKEAGLPDGVFNVINGDKESVDAILENKDIKAVSFVGSTPIAKYIYENSAKNEKRAEALKVGPGMDKTSEMGPLVTKEHLEKVKSYVDLGVEEGAKLVVDGRNLKLQGYENGFYIGGCLFDHVTKDMRVYKEEIFGPVLSVVRVKTFEDAAKLINDHEYGNGVSIYTRDGDAGRTFASKIQVGMVGINVPIPVPMAFHSFGGWKRSLFGDSAMHGMEGIKFYTKLKTVTSRWPSGIRSNAEFVMPTMK